MRCVGCVNGALRSPFVCSHHRLKERLRVLLLEFNASLCELLDSFPLFSSFPHSLYFFLDKLVVQHLNVTCRGLNGGHHPVLIGNENTLVLVPFILNLLSSPIYLGLSF